MLMLRLCSLVCAAAALSLAAVSTNAADHTMDKLETVKSRVQNKQAVLIDVREQREWDEGHLAKARLVPLSRIRDPEQREAVAKSLPNDKIIYLHCKSGARTLAAASFLEDFELDIRPLRPGYESLVEAGFAKAMQDDSDQE